MQAIILRMRMLPFRHVLSFIKKHFRTLKSPQQQAVHPGKGARLETSPSGKQCKTPAAPLLGNDIQLRNGGALFPAPHRRPGVKLKVAGLHRPAEVDALNSRILPDIVVGELAFFHFLQFRPSSETENVYWLMRPLSLSILGV